VQAKCSHDCILELPEKEQKFRMPWEMFDSGGAGGGRTAGVAAGASGRFPRWRARGQSVEQP